GLRSHRAGTCRDTARRVVVAATVAVVPMTPRRIEITIPGRCVPARRMTTRSKHFDPRAVAYNAWQQHVWEQAWLALRDQGWSADDGPLYPRGVRLTVTVI